MRHKMHILVTSCAFQLFISINCHAVTRGGMLQILEITPPPETTPTENTHPTDNPLSPESGSWP